MKKQITLNNQLTQFQIDDTGRLYNTKTQRWLKGGINKGYHFYSIYFQKKQYAFYTHRLVAQYFVPNPNNFTIVHHIDGNKLNNIYTNLQWVNEEEHSQMHIRADIKLPSRNYIKLEQYAENDLAQFRNSPYYATRDGEILNIAKGIKIHFEKSGNYYRFSGYYNLNKQHFLVHRVIWEAFNGPIPAGYDIDHIDGNAHNNALNNLQAITHSDNLKNVSLIRVT